MASEKSVGGTKVSPPPPPPDEAKVCTYGGSSILDHTVGMANIGDKIKMTVTGEVVELSKSQRKGRDGYNDPYDNRTEIRLAPESVECEPVGRAKGGTMADDMNAHYKSKTGYGPEDTDED